MQPCKLPWSLCLLVTFLLLEVASSSTRRQQRPKPNIVYILADDAGWADFQTHDPLMRTGNVSRLGEEGVFLNQSYVLPMCSPTRAALLTGRYPHTFGMQDNVVGTALKTWLPETLTLLPQEMQRLGYRTHMLGKWHMGYCHPGLTPLGRGFDTFYGFWLGSHTSYYEHTKGQRGIYDWWDGDQVDWSAQGVYQTDLLNDRAVRIVEESNSSQPFFMYLAYGAPHGPFEVPQHYRDRHCPHVTNTSRQIHCGMMAALDEGVGKLVTALKDKGVYDNTVILFMSDNGGPTESGSVNWPLRGGKKSVFEGGVRSYTILKAPGLARTNVTWPGMAHAIDWLPTLVTMAGGRKPRYSHGKNLWWKIKRNLPSPRRHFIYNVDDFSKFNHIAIRANKWKLIGPVPGLAPERKWSPGFIQGWYPPYQLIDNGEAAWEDEKRKYSPSQYLLYDLDKDPEERHNLANSPGRAGIMRLLQRKINLWVAGRAGVRGPGPKYPLQPLVTNPQRTRGGHVKDGHLTTCWCLPPAFAADPARGDDCPLLSQ